MNTSFLAISVLALLSMTIGAIRYRPIIAYSIKSYLIPTSRHYQARVKGTRYHEVGYKL